MSINYQKKTNDVYHIYELNTLVEHKTSYAGPASELSIYNTYQKAEKVKFRSDQLLYCGMLAGKKVIHTNHQYSNDFLPHESFIMAPNQLVEIDFPDADFHSPTTCLTIEISKEKIHQVAEMLNEHYSKDQIYGEWEYNETILHTHHNSEIQALLIRMVTIYKENHQDRSLLIDMAISELTIRLLRQQTRNFILAFSQKDPEYNGLNEAINYLFKNASDNIDIDHLSRLACMSRTKFFQKFKLHLGCTPYVFQQKIRLKKAAELIKAGHQITKVCFETGFSDASHFSRIFKRFYGLSPSQYKSKFL